MDAVSRRAIRARLRMALGRAARIVLLVCSRCAILLRLMCSRLTFYIPSPPGVAIAVVVILLIALAAFATKRRRTRRVQAHNMPPQHQVGYASGPGGPYASGTGPGYAPGGQFNGPYATESTTGAWGTPGGVYGNYAQGPGVQGGRTGFGTAGQPASPLYSPPSGPPPQGSAINGTTYDTDAAALYAPPPGPPPPAYQPPEHKDAGHNA